MARHMGDDAFAERCEALQLSGAAWVEENLWNGEYYVQDVQPFAEALRPTTGISWSGFMTYRDGEVPGQQPGDGCMTDQLIGNYTARLVGLGDVFRGERIRKALESIYRHNFVRPLWDYSNPTRAFAVNDEAMVVVGTYPHGIPDDPCMRFFENWTGVEYALSTNLVFAGFTEHAVEVVEAVRNRFDGKKRNPFDEPEAGRHYARAMAAWSVPVALTGFGYDAVSMRLRFARPSALPARWFFSTGRCWGTVTFDKDLHGMYVRVAVGEGTIRISSIEISSYGEAQTDTPTTVSKSEAFEVTIAP